MKSLLTRSSKLLATKQIIHSVIVDSTNYLRERSALPEIINRVYTMKIINVRAELVSLNLSLEVSKRKRVMPAMALPPTAQVCFKGFTPNETLIFFDTSVEKLELIKAPILNAVDVVELLWATYQGDPTEAISIVCFRPAAVPGQLVKLFLTEDSHRVTFCLMRA